MSVLAVLAIVICVALLIGAVVFGVLRNRGANPTSGSGNKTHGSSATR